MTAREALQLAVDLGISCSVTSVIPSQNPRFYLERGREPPDRALPGRIIMLLAPEVRAGLAQLTSNAAADVAPWWIKQVCG